MGGELWLPMHARNRPDRPLQPGLETGERRATNLDIPHQSAVLFGQRDAAVDRRYGDVSRVGDRYRPDAFP